MYCERAFIVNYKEYQRFENVREYQRTRVIETIVFNKLNRSSRLGPLIIYYMDHGATLLVHFVLKNIVVLSVFQILLLRISRIIWSWQYSRWKQFNLYGFRGVLIICSFRLTEQKLFIDKPPFRAQARTIEF